MSHLAHGRARAALTTFRSGAQKFFFEPATAKPLAALRIGLAATLLLQALSLRHDLFDLYGRAGILQGTLAGLANGLALPNLASIGRWLGVAVSASAERLMILSVFGAYVLSLLMLLVGRWTRTFALAAWLFQMLLFSGHVAFYGVDTFAHMFLFYLVWMPSGRAWSLDERFRAPSVPTTEARLGLRVVQLHLCIAYFFSGYEKALGEQWWNGEAIWRSLMLPLYNQADFGWLAGLPWLAKLLAWGTLVLEIGYPIFIWGRRTRMPWMLGITALHLGIALFLGLGIFGIAMTVFTLAVFGPSADPASSGREICVEPVTAKPRGQTAEVAA